MSVALKTSYRKSQTIATAKPKLFAGAQHDTENKIIWEGCISSTNACTKGNLNSNFMYLRFFPKKSASSFLTHMRVSHKPWASRISIQKKRMSLEFGLSNSFVVSRWLGPKTVLNTRLIDDVTLLLGTLFPMSNSMRALYNIFV